MFSAPAVRARPRSVSTADEIGVSVRPVVELHGGEVEAPGEVDDRSRVAVGPVVGDEPVAQSTARIASTCTAVRATTPSQSSSIP